MTTTSRTDRARQRDERLAALLPEREHHEGCPGIDGEHRIEGYTQHRPAQPQKNRDERDVLVVRCLHCGGSRVREEGTYQTLIDPGPRG